jgi:hypothetical protein
VVLRSLARQMLGCMCVILEPSDNCHSPPVGLLYIVFVLVLCEGQVCQEVPGQHGPKNHCTLFRKLKITERELQ